MGVPPYCARVLRSRHPPLPPPIVSPSHHPKPKTLNPKLCAGGEGGNPRGGTTGGWGLYHGGWGRLNRIESPQGSPQKGCSYFRKPPYDGASATPRKGRRRKGSDRTPSTLLQASTILPARQLQLKRSECVVLGYTATRVEGERRSQTVIST